MDRAPYNVPDTKSKPSKSHDDISSDTEAYLSKGGSVQVIARRTPSPPPNKSCDGII